MTPMTHAQDENQERKRAIALLVYIGEREHGIIGRDLKKIG